MPSYAAFIGHQPHLSLAELAATVPGFMLRGKLDRSMLLFESDASLDGKFMDTLGGTVILVEQITDKKYVMDDLPELLAGRLMSVKGKATFSLRTVGVAPITVKKLYRQTKDLLKKKGKPSRYVGNESHAAPSIVLRQNGITDGSGGAELCIIKREEEDLWVGLTVGAQDVEAYTKRDMEKPVRDTTVGLLPPKLAQIMLNLGLWLAKKDPSKEKVVIFDPFCGTGVIPMECLIRGCAVLASDKSEKAVTGCTKNLDWLRKQTAIKKSDVSSKVWKHDATKSFDVEGPVTAIVTETSLGPGLTKRPTVREVQSHKAENEKLQEAFLKAAATSFPGVPIVCIWPVWYSSKEPTNLERVWKAIDEAGYQAVLPPTIEIVDDRMSLLYRRPDQFVGREIVLLKPKRK